METEARTQILAVQLDGTTVDLELRVYKPEGEGPFPTLVFNHGSTGAGTDPDSFKWPIRFTEIANFLVRRGWAVLAPARRGRAGSQGVYDEGFSIDRTQGYSAEAVRSIKGAERALEDIEAVMLEIPSLSFVDSKRLLIGGESRGGILSVAYAGKNAEKVLGVVNFVGGWIEAGLATSEKINQTIFRWGADSNRETLWLYGDNDGFYPLCHSRKSFDVFQQAGGYGSWHEIEPPEGIDGHIISMLPSLWSEKIEKYLKQLGLPYKESASFNSVIEWPGFQSSLLPSESKSAVKALLPKVVFNPDNTDTNTERNKLGGIWQGWMGYGAHIDVKVGIYNTSNDKIIVEFSQASEGHGLYNDKITLSYDGDLLVGIDTTGAELFLEVRADGYMNIGRRNNPNFCTGVLAQTSPVDL